MKNELGRKITSLTLMAIMLGWGVTMAGPLAVPEAAAYGDNTAGTLSVSSTHIQGGAILGINVADGDPTNSSVTAPGVTLAGKSVQMNQLSDGSWQAYVVDESTVEAYMLATANSYTNVLSNNSSFDYGMYCASGLGDGNDATFEIVDVEVFALFPNHGSDLDLFCKNVDERDDLGAANTHTMSFLRAAPAINSDSSAGSFGQQGHKINGSTGVGSWPYIQANIDFAGTQDVCYGSDCVTVYYGNTDGETSLSITNL